MENLLALRVTPGLRHFVRAELAWLLRTSNPDGIQWSAKLIEREIRDEPAIPGTVSDDTIRRFIADQTAQQTKPAAVLTLAGFLVHFEYVSAEHLRRHSCPGNERAAAYLADMFPQAGDREPILAGLIGVFRSYRWAGAGRLRETILTLAGTEPHAAWTAQLDQRLYVLGDARYLDDGTDNLHPARYHLIPALLAEDPNPEPAASVSADGIGVRALPICCLLFGGPEFGTQGLVVVEEIHLAGEQLAGFRAQTKPSWQLYRDGGRIPPAVEDAEANLVPGMQDFYPQLLPATFVPIVEAIREAGQDSESQSGRFDFSNIRRESMDRRSWQIVEAERLDVEAETALAACASEDERLAVAISLWRTEAAIAAIEAGANVNLVHPRSGLPVAHMAAGFGMRSVLEAMLATGRCDLTVRDQYNRLAHSCAAVGARDVALSDWLMEQQAKQFADRGINPHKMPLPGTPEPGQ